MENWRVTNSQGDSFDQQDLVAFRLANQAYALPIEPVVRIIEMVTITPIPQVSGVVEGVINVRGAAVPVINLRRHFGLPEIPWGLRTPIILIQIDEQTFGLIVDEATSIDREARTVATASGTSLGYEKSVLATGGLPIIIPIPGKDLENVFCATKDVDYIKKLLKTLDEVKDVVIIGGGFIGLEFGDELRKRGLNVTIVEMLPHCLQLVFDEDFCSVAENKLRERGIVVKTKVQAEAILGEKKVEGVKLNTGEELKADLAFMCIGVRPNTGLAQKAGLQIGETKGIWVDDYGRTSDKDIFAIGDCAEKKSFFTKKPSNLRLASIACNEARNTSNTKG